MHRRIAAPADCICSPLHSLHPGQKRRCTKEAVHAGPRKHESPGKFSLLSCTTMYLAYAHIATLAVITIVCHTRECVRVHVHRAWLLSIFRTIRLAACVSLMRTKHFAGRVHSRVHRFIQGIRFEDVQNTSQKVVFLRFFFTFAASVCHTMLETSPLIQAQ